MVKIALTLVPVAGAVAAAMFRHSLAVRLIAVAAVLLSTTMTVGVLIAPHRVAEELVHQSPQSSEWRRGARDTRDAIYGILPVLASSFAALALLAIIPIRKKPR